MVYLASLLIEDFLNLAGFLLDFAFDLVGTSFIAKIRVSYRLTDGLLGFSFKVFSSSDGLIFSAFFHGEELGLSDYFSTP